MCGRDGTSRFHVLAVEQSLTTFPQNPTGLSAVTCAAVSPNPLLADRAVELENVSIPVRLLERTVGVQLYVANFGPSRHVIILSVNEQCMCLSFLLSVKDAQ